MSFMRILYIVDYFYPHVGGVPTLFYNITRQMVKKKHEVTVITTRGKIKKAFEIIDGIKIYRFGKNREQFLLHSILFLLKFSKRFDLIHTSTYSAMIPAYIFSKIRKIKTVLNVHEVWSLKEWLEFTSIKGLFYFLEERLLFYLPFNIYISPSKHTEEDIKRIGVSQSRIEMIQHGIDNSIFNPKLKKFRKEFRKQFNLPEDLILASFIGKPTIFKGIVYLLKSIMRISAKKIKFVFLLSKTHESSYKNFLRYVKKFDSLKSKIIILNTDKDQSYVSKVIAASDFLIMPSLTEGFGFVAAESISTGVPVIATADSSLREVVDENINGIFVRSRDADELKEAIEKIVNDKDLRDNLNKPKKFAGWLETVRKYEIIYKKLVNFKKR